MEWIKTVLKEDYTIDNFITIKTRNELCDRLLDKIICRENNDEEILYNFLLSLNDEEITRLYYKNNMIYFIQEHEEIQDLFEEILYKVENLDYARDDDDWLMYIPDEYRNNFFNKKRKEWDNFVNKCYFMDPNDPPESIIDLLNILCDYIIKYVFVEYLSVDRIYRLRNFKRKVVTVIDTDSNFLSLDTLMNFLLDKMVKDNSFGRSYNNNEFIIINTITYLITVVIEKMMLFYGKYSNIPEEERPRFNMKNEIYNELLVIGKAKKRYISKQRLKEGNLVKDGLSDIKGFDFMKASTSEYAGHVFMNLINKHILNKDNKIEIKEMIKGLKEFKKEIKHSMLNGKTDFLPLGSAKELAAYKDPGTNQSVRGVLTWNALYPDNMIDFPSKVNLLKMTIFKESDIDDLKETNEDIYNIIIDKVFNDTTGIFVTKTYDNGIDYVNTKKKEWYKDIPKKYQTKYKKLGASAWNEFVDEVLGDENGKYAKLQKQGRFIYKKKGLQVLAIPSNSDIPEWCQPYIDYSTMINNIIAPFKPVLEIFGPQFIEEGRSYNSVNRKSTTVTNIVKF